MSTEPIPETAAEPVLPAPARSVGHRGPRTRLITERRVVFTVSMLCYAGVAWWFWRNHLIPGDATSRLASAYYILFSRDPHLAALGFVWNPLPSLVLLPVLPLKDLAPALTRDGLLIALSSALFMAGTVALGNDMLHRLRLARPVRICLTVLLALNPMMLIYGGNGMSEAVLLFFLMLSARGLLDWLQRGRAESLVTVGVGLGLAYGARYEALAAGLAVPALVMAVSLWRSRAQTATRFATARVDAALAGLPVLMAVVGWGAVSKIVVGQWFATFSSEYGNSAQVQANKEGIESVTGVLLAEKLAYALRQLAGLEPLLPALLVVAAVVALRRRDPRPLAPLSLFGPVLLFSNLAFLTGNSFGWLRFQIAAVPLVVLLVGCLLSAPRAGRPRARSSWREGRDRTHPLPWLNLGRSAVVVAALVAVAAAMPATVATLANPALAREESEWFTEAGALRTAGLARLHTRIAGDLDAMELPEGSVVTDSAYAFPIILASRRPRQFVITSDRDFRAVVKDPAGNRVRYLLISATGAADAVRLAHPGARDHGKHQGGRQWTDQWGKPAWALIPADEVA